MPTDKSVISFLVIWGIQLMFDKLNSGLMGEVKDLDMGMEVVKDSVICNGYLVILWIAMCYYGRDEYDYAVVFLMKHCMGTFKLFMDVNAKKALKKQPQVPYTP